MSRDAAIPLLGNIWNGEYVHRCKFLCAHMFHFIRYLEVGLLCHVINFVFNFIRNCPFLFQSGHTILYVCIQKQHMSLYVCIARRSNHSILKEINPEYPLEGLMLKLKLQYSGYLMWRTDIGKDPEAGKDWRREKGTTEDEIVGCHCQLNEHEFE